MEKDNSLLFFEFLRANGFEPNNYESVLELLQTAKGSLSKYLIYFKHYLLSEKVRKDELDIYGIHGETGYIDKNKIILIEKRNFKLEENKKIPTLNEFESIICYHEDFNNEIKNIYNMIDCEQDKYFGFVTNKNDEKLETKLKIYKKILEHVNNNGNKKYELIHDELNCYEKEFYLVKRRNLK